MFDRPAGEFLELELMLMGVSESSYFLQLSVEGSPNNTSGYLPSADVEAPKLNRAVQGW